ncbi:MAG TPA: BatA domain-containing protein [Cytophagaceae bacterium]|jgi:hypothetical protein
MSFIYPQFLYALAAISIPVIIHLFNFQKPKKVFFSNIEFLKAVKQSTSNKLKLKHLLILLARILFIAFLVLAFAQPFLRSDNAGDIGTKQIVAFYLDNSYSMQNEKEGAVSLESGIKAITQVSELYPKSSRFILITNDFEAKDDYLRDVDQLKERLTELKFSNIYRDFLSVSKRIERIEEGQSKNIFFISDFQKSTTGDLNKLSLDSANRYYLVPIKGENHSNLYVDSIGLKTPLIRPDENNTLEVTLVNTSAEKIEDRIVKLYIDNIQVSSANITIPASGKQRTVFNFSVSGGEDKKCKISFDDSPVSFDNDYFFTLNVSPKINILHITDATKTYIDKVYENENVFRITKTLSGSIDYTAISGANEVVLENVTEINASLTDALVAFVKKGGSLFIVPSSKPDLTSYSDMFRKIGMPIGSVVVSDTANANLFTIVPPDINNPFFQNIFEKLDKNLNLPYASPVFSGANGRTRLLSLKNGGVLLSSNTLGSGKVYLLNTAFDGKMTNLPYHALFVPVMYKVAFRSKNESERLAYNFDEGTIPVKMNNVSANTIFELKTDQIKLIPNQRLAEDNLYLEIPNMDLKPGYYSLVKKDSVVRTLAFNYSKKESIMDFYQQEELNELKGMYPNVQVYSSTDTSDFVKDFKKDNIGISLWKYCIVLSLIFLMTEVLLIRLL